MFKAWFIKTSGTPLTKMGHGIEQAIMRFVRSTSVTLKVLTAMIQMCFGECNCWVQRQCIWEPAITKVRSDNGKVILCYSSLKSKNEKTKKSKTKTASQWTCLEQHCLGLPEKEVRLFEKKHRWHIQISPDLERSQRRGLRGGLQASHWRHVRQGYSIQE